MFGSKTSADSVFGFVVPGMPYNYVLFVEKLNLRPVSKPLFQVTVTPLSVAIAMKRTFGWKTRPQSMKECEGVPEVLEQFQRAVPSVTLVHHVTVTRRSYPRIFAMYEAADLKAALHELAVLAEENPLCQDAGFLPWFRASPSVHPRPLFGDLQEFSAEARETFTSLMSWWETNLALPQILEALHRDPAAAIAAVFEVSRLPHPRAVSLALALLTDPQRAVPLLRDTQAMLEGPRVLQDAEAIVAWPDAPRAVFTSLLGAKAVHLCDNSWWWAL